MYTNVFYHNKKLNKNCNRASPFYQYTCTILFNMSFYNILYIYFYNKSILRESS